MATRNALAEDDARQLADDVWIRALAEATAIDEESEKVEGVALRPEVQEIRNLDLQAEDLDEHRPRPRRRRKHRNGDEDEKQHHKENRSHRPEKAKTSSRS